MQGGGGKGLVVVLPRALGLLCIFLFSVCEMLWNRTGAITAPAAYNNEHHFDMTSTDGKTVVGYVAGYSAIFILR